MTQGRSGYVYLMYSESTDWCKIGHSKHPEQRIAQVNAEVPGLSWQLDSTMYCDDRYAVEKAWHEAFAEYRITPGKEWFVLSVAQVQLFKTVCEQVSRVPSMRDVSRVENDDVVKDAEALIEMARARFGTEAGNPLAGIRSQWPAVLDQLRHNGHPLTAAIFEQAHLSAFDGAVLLLSFPEDLGLYVGMVYEHHHYEQLNKALEQKLGERLDVQAELLGAA